MVLWEDIKHDHPPELKISPLAMIPHKFRQFRAPRLILPGQTPGWNYHALSQCSYNQNSPRGAINQIGHSLQRIIHAFATADRDAKIFMTKFNIKDGFWRLDCKTGQEWNFCYVLPQPPNQPVKLVVPTSLRMGWIESPPYFCVASETA